MPELIESQIEFGSMEMIAKLSEIERYFRRTRYDALVDEAMSLYYQGRINELKETLKRFPTKEKLLAELMRKLKHKPVWVTLKRISNETTKNDWTKFKGLASLLTSVAIEAEKGNGEYKYLLVDVYEKLGEMLPHI